MRALFDESVPLVRGNYAYVVVGTILVQEDGVVVRETVEKAVGGRLRPFHWVREGPEARQRMIDCAIHSGACAHVAVHHPTGRRRQENARQMGLARLLPLVLADGVAEIVIESRGAVQDGRDRVLLLDELGVLGRRDVTYSWAPKANSELWLADAICGSVSAFLTGEDISWYEQLREARVVQEPIYLSGA